nr:ABC transporter permease subunit [uncultured Sellimonas sp.]
MISTTSRKKKKRKIRLWAVAVWLLVWQAVSVSIGQEILLVSPVVVLKRLFELVQTRELWYSILFSLIRILGGFLLAMVTGVLMAGLSYRFKRIRELLAPAVLTIKAIPVASFVILVLIWVPSENLSVVISFLMVFPVIYTNVLNGIESMDQKLLEMAEVFELSARTRIRYIYVSQVLPFFRAGCSLGLGLCWKAGVAAEVIGLPDKSIGEQLYNAKVYLNTPDLFAWTIVIVLISLLFEKLFLATIDRVVYSLERMK